MEQRRFLMSQKELQRYHVVSKTIEGRMSTKEAAEMLGLSQRQVFRQKAKIMSSRKKRSSFHLPSTTFASSILLGVSLKGSNNICLGEPDDSRKLQKLWTILSIVSQIKQELNYAQLHDVCGAVFSIGATALWIRNAGSNQPVLEPYLERIQTQIHHFYYCFLHVS